MTIVVPTLFVETSYIEHVSGAMWMPWFLILGRSFVTIVVPTLFVETSYIEHVSGAMWMPWFLIQLRSCPKHGRSSNGVNTCMLVADALTM